MNPRATPITWDCSKKVFISRNVLFSVKKLMIV
jgi:hypothetical protein